MAMRVVLLLTLAAAGLATMAGDANARYWRGSSYYSGNLYGSVYGGGLFGGPWGFYGERRGFYGGPYGVYSDGARLRPVDGQSYDASRCDNRYVKVRNRGRVQTRQIFRCQ